MADSQEHLQQARANRLQAEQLLRTDSGELAQSAVDWAVTVAFYAAVHHVDAWLADRGLAPRTHAERHRYMAEARVGDDVRMAYRILFDLSQQGRYYSMRHFDQAFVEAAVLRNWLPRVEALTRDLDRS